MKLYLKRGAMLVAAHRRVVALILGEPMDRNSGRMNTAYCCVEGYIHGFSTLWIALLHTFVQKNGLLLAELRCDMGSI